MSAMAIPEALRICAMCENDVASAKPICERCRHGFEADREMLMRMLRETEKDRSALLETLAGVDRVLLAAEGRETPAKAWEADSPSEREEEDRGSRLMIAFAWGLAAETWVALMILAIHWIWMHWK